MNGYGDCLKCKAFSKSTFACLDSDVVTKSITGNSISITYKKGQDVFLEDSLAKGVFCIQSGKVKIYKKCSERNLIVGLGKNSDLLGYQAMFNGDKFGNSAKCLEDSQICFIPKKAFMSILSSSNEMLMHLLKQSSIENHELSNFVRELKCKNTLGRIASALIRVSEKFGLDEDKCLNITLTRKEVSELSGTTTESAIRILNDMKKEKVITFHNNRIKILDMNKLLRYITG